MSPIELSDFSKMLLENYYIFDFSTAYRIAHDSILSADRFELTDEIWDSFSNYLANKDLSYESELEKRLEKLKAEAQRQGIYDDFKEVCENIQKKINAKKEGELDSNRGQIERILKTDLVSRYYYNRGIIIANLYQDKAIKNAMKLLHSPDEYKDLLK